MSDHISRLRARKQDAYDRGYKAGYNAGHSAALRAMKETLKTNEWFTGSPEERELEDKIQHSLDVSRMALMLSFLRGPVSAETTPSPNTASYTDGDERSPP